ncbi:MAG: DNA cytosine methyltransferase [Treponemataceae bacterium]|nr:DNA cytosine methyltransferase [Treponemataceae bacterium]
MCKQTICELFAGVGGFRLGLERSSPKWETVWANQWEPGKQRQDAFDCYCAHFGKKDIYVNEDISLVDKFKIPNHNLLVGGFPCQDYSVARSLNGEKGIEGKKGVLWWSILEILKAKKPPFVLLENVDRLLISPSKQRGRDFGIILSCLNSEGYIVEWRVVNAAEYGEVQRRRRIFIFAYKTETNFAKSLELLENQDALDVIKNRGFFAQTFALAEIELDEMKIGKLPSNILTVSDEFKFDFKNSGVMFNGNIFTVKTIPQKMDATPLKAILEKSKVAEKYFISEKNLYYTDLETTHSDETETEIPKESRHTWQYIKGAKRKWRTTKNGHRYIYSEGAIPMIDKWDAPARTMLTSEGSFNRSTHIVRDLNNKKIRILTPVEAERIQGFPDNWTNTGMSEKFRYFCMGNALVVGLVEKMGRMLNKIFDAEKE